MYGRRATKIIPLYFAPFQLFWGDIRFRSSSRREASAVVLHEFLWMATVESQPLSKVLGTSPADISLISTVFLRFLYGSFIAKSYLFALALGKTSQWCRCLLTSVVPWLGRVESCRFLSYILSSCVRNKDSFGCLHSSWNLTRDHWNNLVFMV